MVPYRTNEGLMSTLMRLDLPCPIARTCRAGALGLR